MNCTELNITFLRQVLPMVWSYAVCVAFDSVQSRCKSPALLPSPCGCTIDPSKHGPKICTSEEKKGQKEPAKCLQPDL